MVQLVHAGQFDLVPKISNLGTGFGQGMQMANQFQAGKQKRLEDTQEQSFLRAEVINKGLGVLANTPEADRPAVFESMKGQLKEAGIDANVFTDLDFSDAGIAASQASIQPLLGRSSVTDNANKVGARKIYKNGLILQSTQQGPRVFTPGGEELVGADAQAAIDAANEFEKQFSVEQVSQQSTARGAAESKVAADSELQKGLGKEASKVYAKLQQAAQSASAFIPRLKSLKKLAESVRTGFGADAQLLASKVLGIEAVDTEELNAKLGELAQDILNQQTGTKTDFDFQNAVRQSASLGKTPEANARLIEALIERQKQAVRFGDMAKEARKKGGAEAVLDLRYSAPESDRVEAPSVSTSNVKDLINKYAD